MEVVGGIRLDVGLLGSERFFETPFVGSRKCFNRERSGDRSLVLWLALGLRNLAVSASIPLEMMDYSSKQISGGHRFD